MIILSQRWITNSIILTFLLSTGILFESLVSAELCVFLGFSEEVFDWGRRFSFLHTGFSRNGKEEELKEEEFREETEEYELLFEGTFLVFCR